jgi:hypothetical protein
VSISYTHCPVFLGYTPVLCIQDQTPLSSLFLSPVLTASSLATPQFTMFRTFLSSDHGSTTCICVPWLHPIFYVFRVPPSILCVPWLHSYSLYSGCHHLSSMCLGYTPILCVQGSITCALCSLATPLFSVFRVPPPVLCVPWLNPYSLCSGFHHLSSVFHGYTPILCVQGSITCPLCSLATPPILCVQGSATCPLCSMATPLFSVFRVPSPVLCVPWLHPYSLCSGFH